MGKKSWLLVILLILSSMLFASPSSSKIILLDNPIYKNLDALYLISGYSYPSKSRPWSVGEAYTYLSKINKNELDEAEIKFYSKVEKELENLNSDFSFEDELTLDLNLDVNLALRSHLNAGYNLKEEWCDKQIPPLIKLDIGFGITDHLYFQTEFNLLISEYSSKDMIAKVPNGGVGALIKPNTDAYYLTHSDYYSKYFETNLIGGGHRIDLYWPKSCYMSSSFGPFSLSLFRGKTQIGNGKTGQLILSDNITNNLFKFSANTKYFKFDWINLFFQDERIEQELPLEKFKIQMIHRFEVRPLSFLSISLTDSVMFVSPILEMGYLNPSFIFHNLYNRSSLNAIASLELSITPYKGWNIYFDGVLDQAQSIGESNWEANSFGFIIGSEYNKVIKTGLLKCYIEYGLTSPCLYRRDKVDFTTMFPHYAPDNKEAVELSYIGYKYGPDSQVLEMNIAYESFNNFEIPLTLSLIRKGEMNFFTPHNTDGSNTNTSNITSSTPYGNIVFEKAIFSFAPKFKLPYGFSIRSNISFIGKREYNKKLKTYYNHSCDFQFTLALQYSI